MIKNKNNIKTLLGIVLCLIVLYLAFWTTLWFFMPNLVLASNINCQTDNGTPTFIKNDGETPYMCKVDASKNILDSDFKIMTSSDLHINKNSNIDFTLEVMRRFFKKEKPDLFVVLGDTILTQDEELFLKFKNFFEEQNQYWAFVLGNHDGECVKGSVEDSRQWAYNKLIGGPHCITYDEGGQEVYGSGNYTINIKNSHGIIQTLYFFDSGDYIDETEAGTYDVSKGSYAFIKENQIEWYSNRVNEITVENGGRKTKSTIFIHIPLPEYKTAVKNIGKNGTTKIYGNNLESVCCSKYNSGLFDKIKELNSTHSVICGHDHNNDSNILYNDVRLIYSQGLHYGDSYNRYKDKFLLRLGYFINPEFCYFTEGVTLLMCRQNSAVEIVPKYTIKENLYSGLNKYFVNSGIPFYI